MVNAVFFIILVVLATSVSSKIQVGCTVGWTYHPGSRKCRSSIWGFVSYLDAHTECRDKNAKLYKIKSQAEWQKSVLPLLKKPNNEFGVYGMWPHNYDDFLTAASSQCRFIKADENGTFPKTLNSQSYISEPCSNPYFMMFVCERDAVLTDCFGSSCYHLIHDGEGCLDDNAHLARIESREENELVKGFLKEAPQAADRLNFFSNNYKNNVHAVISGTDAEREKTWLFDNGVEMTFFDWARGEPSNSGWNKAEDCVAMKLGQRSQWNDISCDSSKSSVYLCEEDNKSDWIKSL